MADKGSPEVALRHSARARRLRLVVKPTGVEVVLPPGVSEADGLRFFRQHQDWAARKLFELQGRVRQRMAPVDEPALGVASSIPFQGCDVPLIVHHTPAGRLRVLRENETGPFEIWVGAESPLEQCQQIHAALFAWVKRWMRTEAARMALVHGEALGLLPRDIRIKQMRSRWGSCGVRNDIQLNWVLAFAPPAVLEYVVVHEICHIRHRDHSAQFWALVTRMLPDWQRERQWLKQNGGALLRRFAP